MKLKKKRTRNNKSTNKLLIVQTKWVE